MSWLDTYREASFRNVPFNVVAHDHKGGRRNAVNVLPGRDEPDIRDLGSAVKKFTLDMYVLDEDYQYNRDSLLDALDKGGPGKLVHPYLGTIKVVVEDYSMREQATERRMARFTVTFIKAGIQKYPSTEVAPAEIVAEKKQTALEATHSDFLSKYDLTNQVYSIVANVKENLDEATERIALLRKTVSISPDFQSDLASITGNISALAFDTTSLANSFLNIINFGTDLGLEEFELTADNARIQYDELRKFWQSFDNVSLNTVNDNDPTISFVQLCQRVAVISAAGFFNIMTVSSWDEAKEILNVLFDKIQTLVENTDDDDVFASLQDLRAVVYREFELRESSLPRLVVYTPPLTINTLFISYFLYGSIEREQEIIDRNKIRHPGFSPGQKSLEVLLDVN